MSGTVSAYETAAGKRYRVRYRKPDKSQTDKRGFRTKKEAELFLASVTVSKARGEYLDPALSRVAVAQLYETWIIGKKSLKPSAFAQLPIAWRLHVEPKWGAREVGGILPSEVRTWVTELTQDKPDGTKGRSATVALRALGVLAGVLDVAVDDRRIARNPARGMKNLPRKPKRKAGRVYLTHDQVHTLAAESARPELVLTLAYTGLRWGEAAALRVRSVNLLRQRLHVEENAVQVDGVIHVGTPKTWQIRSVPFPKFLAPLLERAARGKGPDDLLFGDGTSHLRPPRYGTGWFEGAVARVQARDDQFPRITAHDLRHTAASLAIAAGANVKALQRMLGHESAAITLDVYADLFDDDLSAVSANLETAAREQSVGKSWAALLA
ncbi:tyrosine-type recombinase/integrase [Microbacterium algeriense]|uniref:Tyrosine-type recombinase/integrase n=1 Tax=Microbacterium algeriense TaxID=2615184 RepID=A0ABQ6VC53_9MICO|nr:tyrosine-type recombinase/integrase [Microbacterium algeriense]KAB1867301.1 tyrosine-type recombinase/integrase [Microbacterium algeriense]